MASLYLLIPVSLIFCALAIAIFFWAVNNGQYDDLDAEGERLLFGDDEMDSESETDSEGETDFENETSSENEESKEKTPQDDSLPGNTSQGNPSQDNMPNKE